jgi:sortase A
MKTQVYKKASKKNVRKIVRFSGLFSSIAGLILGMYTFFPLISYELYIKPAFASQEFAAPIPQKTIITEDYIQSLLKNTANTLSRLGSNSSQGWMPTTYKEMEIASQLSYYNISIPKLGISNAHVSTIDNNVDEHLVHFAGTNLPPNQGNAAIFGHSTLPQWFDPTNYKAIFSTAHTMQIGDAINVTINNQIYTYKVVDIAIVEPEQADYFEQNTDGSYITIVTCTPPGTIWKRLLIKAKLETL